MVGGCMRDASVLHVLGGSAYGGGSKVVLDLAAAAVRSGARVDILTTSEQLALEATSVGVGIVDEDLIRRSIHPLRDFMDLLRLVRLIRSGGYSIVHTHTSKAGVLGRLAASIAGTPFVVHTVHGFAFHERSPRWQQAAVIALERIASWFCDMVVTVSMHHYQVALGKRIVPSRKLIAIPNGIAESYAVTSEQVSTARESLLRGGDVAVLSHGRLAPQKGLSYLLQGVARLAEAGALPAGVQFSIAGDGPLHAELEAQCRDLGLSDRVQFLGFRNDINQLIAAADLVVLPSLWEGLSIAVMEAMAQGALVAASDIPSNRELISHGRNGLLFEPADVVALAVCLEKAIGDLKALRPLGEQAKSDIRLSHGRAAMQDAYIELYCAALGEKSR